MLPEDHDVVGEHFERHGLVLRASGDGLQTVALPPLDHAHARLRLPPLAAGPR